MNDLMNELVTGAVFFRGWAIVDHWVVMVGCSILVTWIKSSRNKVLVQQRTWNHLACLKAARAERQGSRGNSSSAELAWSGPAVAAAGVVVSAVAAATGPAVVVVAAAVPFAIQGPCCCCVCPRVCVSCRSTDINHVDGPCPQAPATKYLTTRQVDGRTQRAAKRGSRWYRANLIVSPRNV